MTLLCPPFIAGFDQLAYVTTDMDRAVETFADYGLPRFQVEDTNFPATVFGVSGHVALKVAFANVGTHQIELIQPVDGLCQLYADPLPTDGSFAIKLHHIRMRVAGTLDDWARTRDQVMASGRPIALLLEYPALAVVYVDDRQTLGHYTEYAWFHPDELDARTRRTPFYENNR